MEQPELAQNEEKAAVLWGAGQSFTSVIGKLQVVVVEGKEVLDGRDAARARGQLPDTVVLAGQDLQVVICQDKRRAGLSWGDGDSAQTRTDRGSNSWAEGCATHTALAWQVSVHWGKELRLLPKANLTEL